MYRSDTNVRVILDADNVSSRYSDDQKYRIDVDISLDENLPPTGVETCFTFRCKGQDILHPNDFQKMDVNGIRADREVQLQAYNLTNTPLNIHVMYLWCPKFRFSKKNPEFVVTLLLCLERENKHSDNDLNHPFSDSVMCTSLVLTF